MTAKLESGKSGIGGRVQYEDFSVTLERGESGFRVRLLRSPYGCAVSTFSSPFEGKEMRQLLTRLEHAMLRGARREHQRDLAVMGPEASEVSPAAIAERVGTALFEALFSGAVRERYLLSLGLLDSRSDMGLRLRLVLDPTGPELGFLCSLPWELLYRPETRNFIGRDPRTPLCRFLDVPQPSYAPPIADRLRVLVAMASPVDAPPLDLLAERQRIEEAWAHHTGVSVEFVEHAGIEEVYRKLQDEPHQVLHFMGHGDFEGRNGILLFENERGEGAPVTGEVLGESLRSIRSLRLVFLNACQSAAFSRQAGMDPYTGVANALVMRGVPAVLAMQFPISDEAAVRFSGAFYSFLAAGDPVDRAAAEGRLAVYRSAPDSLEWATPALFLNVPDGRLFTPQTQSAEPSVQAQQTIKPDVVVWADLQPLFVGDFTAVAQGKIARQRMLGNSFIFGRKGAWSGALEDDVYVLINDSKRTDVKYCYLEHHPLRLAGSPVSVEVAIETIARDQELAGAGLLYSFDPLSESYYAFLLRPRQRFAFYRCDSLGFRLMHEAQTGVIVTGEFNRLAVLGSDGWLSLYINEQRVKTIGGDHLRGNFVGIVAVSRGRYRFDNFTLFQPLH